MLSRYSALESENVYLDAGTHARKSQKGRAQQKAGGKNACGIYRRMRSSFTLGLMVGISVGDTTLGTAIANLGWDEVRFPKPVFHGDTLRVETEVVDLRTSRSRPEAGIVTFLHRAYNQRGELVAHCKRSGLQKRRVVPA